jgi:hypothetical protein
MARDWCRAASASEEEDGDGDREEEDCSGGGGGGGDGSSVRVRNEGAAPGGSLCPCCRRRTQKSRGAEQVTATLRVLGMSCD